MYVISVSVAKECTYYVSLAGLSMCAAESALVSVVCRECFGQLAMVGWLL